MSMLRYALVLSLALAPVSSVLADSPKETYRNYLGAVGEAARLKEIFPYLTDERIQTIEQGLQNAIEQGVDPITVETFTLDLLKTGVKEKALFRELIIDDEASVVVERADVTIEVLMILKDDSWKIADERMLKIPNFQ